MIVIVSRDATAYYRASTTLPLEDLIAGVHKTGLDTPEPLDWELSHLEPFNNVEVVEIFADDGETLLWSSDQ